MRSLLPLLAGTLALTAALAGPSRAADPATRCQKATTKGLAACVQKLSKAEVACFEKTGVACLAGDPKLASAFAQLDKAIRGGQCPDAAAVAAAGYAPLLADELAERFQEACVREIADISQRVFGGPQGPLLAGAGSADQKCLLRAGKEAGKLLSKALAAAGRCAGRSCDAGDLDRAATKLEALEGKTSLLLERKCGDLAGLIGEDAGTFAGATVNRVPDVAASPCDPIDGDYCMFPFPNDYFSAGDVTSPTGRRLALTSRAMPVNENVAAGTFDPAKWNVLDGFSVGPVLIVHDSALDLAMSGAPPITDLAASLAADAPFLLFADSGERQLLWAERDQVGTTPEKQPTFARVGANLENGRRYIVALRNLRDGSGAALATDPVFAAYRDRTPTRQLPVEARRRHMEQIFAELGAFGVAREDLYLAWDFTTQSAESSSRRLLAMRDDAFEILGADAPSFTVDPVEEPSNNVFRRVRGSFQVPLYLTAGGAPGSELRLGADGLPENQGDFFTAYYNCVIPNSATTAGGPPAVPARLSLYGHGLLGSRNEASSSHVRAFASEHNFVICGTDWTGFAEDDEGFVVLVLRNFTNFSRFIERQHQGVLNFMVLGRLMLHPEGFASHAAFQVGGESMIDPSALFYDGNSQGGILGGVLAAFSQDAERFVLGVPGINYSTLLDRSTDFQRFRDILDITYPDRLDQSLLIAVAQLLWDQTDPSGHVRHTTADPYPNTPPKKILLQVALGDYQVAQVTAENEARTIGAHIHTPVLVPAKLVPEVTPYYDIPPIPAYPFDGSAVVIWDSGNPAPPIGNLPPAEILPTDAGWADLSPCAQNFDSDPHECPRRQPEARLQKSEFLKSDGAVVDVCLAMACLAPAF